MAPWPSPLTNWPQNPPEKAKKSPKNPQKIALPSIDMDKKIKGNGAMAFNSP
jgi:hypothetical protein